MQSRKYIHFFGVLLCCAGLLASIGCAGGAGDIERREENDPLFRRAMTQKNVDDVDGAIDLFNKVLERKPHIARAHLELGLLFDMKKQDYVRALYHYERYLELRPKAEKRELIEGLIRQARLSFAASLPHQPPGAIEEIAMLKKEIALLRGQLDAKPPAERARATVAPAAPAKPAAALQPPPVPKPEPAQPAMQQYVVQSGDTLSRIASKMYGDPNKWRMIYDANRGTLSSPESVRVGQTLLIPR